PQAPAVCQSAVKGRIAVGVGLEPLGNHKAALRQLQLRVKFSATAPLNAVARPDAAKVVEMAGFCRMPVAACHDRQSCCCEQPGCPVERRHYPVSLRYRQSATGAEVVLQINDQQCRVGCHNTHPLTDSFSVRLLRSPCSRSEMETL